MDGNKNYLNVDDLFSYAAVAKELTKLDPHNNQLSVGLIAQVVEQCTLVAEVRVQVPFRPFFC